MAPCGCRELQGELGAVSSVSLGVALGLCLRREPPLCSTPLRPSCPGPHTGPGQEVSWPGPAGLFGLICSSDPPSQGHQETEKSQISPKRKQPFTLLPVQTPPRQLSQPFSRCSQSEFHGRGRRAALPPAFIPGAA